MLSEKYMSKEIRTSEGGSNINVTVNNNFVNRSGSLDRKHRVIIKFTNDDYDYAIPNKEELQQLIDVLTEAKNRMDD